MKYWRGYLTAAILLLFGFGLMKFAEGHGQLIDMVYPYVTRMYQSTMAAWSGGVEFCLWQLAAVILVVLLLATIVLMIILRWNLIQVVGWVTAVASLLFVLHTGVWGLNYYAGDLAGDLRLQTPEYTLEELKEATAYYRDQANELALQIPRDGNSDPKFPEFKELALQAGEGFQNMVYQQHQPIFAGSTEPVKELGWADLYTSMGITGMTMPLTGEAAVNPQIPVVSLPFTMCHEMAHRMCIAIERDANFAAFLAASHNSSPEFRYSAYFMAYRYCYSALSKLSMADAKMIAASQNSLLTSDLTRYQTFFQENRDDKASEVAEKVNDTYLKTSGDSQGTASYNDVCHLLVSWHLQTVVLPSQSQQEKPQFDPFDESKVDLTVTPETEPTTGGGNG